jgi:hypothetical protein
MATLAGEEQVQQWMAGMMTPEMAKEQAAQLAWRLTPDGHATWAAFGFACDAIFLLFFAVAGGALGARIMARTRRPGV